MHPLRFREVKLKWKESPKVRYVTNENACIIWYLEK